VPESFWQNQQVALVLLNCLFALFVGKKQLTGYLVSPSATLVMDVIESKN